jgi:hypothetical protein
LLEFSKVDFLLGADDLIYRLVSLGFVLLSAHFFGIRYQVLKVSYDCFVANDLLGFP